ncbi:MAG TPA: DUF721 domain-containing protein [Spirochaetia bacterium]|nr:DUF721 domain-containing protein [Spirochaetia bacterium]
MERAGNILKKAFAHEETAGSARYLPLFDGFQEVVGKKLAPHVVMRDIQQDTIIAEVFHPGWHQALLLEKAAILKRINARYPGLGINNLKIRISSRPPLPEVRRGEADASFFRKDVSDDSASPSLIETFLSGMDESELKQALRRLFNAGRARRRERKL